MKKVVYLLIAICIIAIMPVGIVYADDNGLQTSVAEQLDGINFDDINKLVTDSINSNGSTFKDNVKDILSGKYFTDYNSLISSIFGLIMGQVKQFIPSLIIILCIAILGSLASSFKSSKTSGVNSIVHFACYGLIIMLITVSITKVCTLTSSTLENMQKQMTILFPILLTLLTAIGSVASVSIYTPIVSILTGGVSLLFSKVMYPMFIISFIFIVLGHLTDTIKLKKINGFISSSFKWLVGIIFTLFSGILAIQGIAAGKADGVSIKLTKFTVKSYIPIIGSYVSDGMDMIVLSSMLIKNAVGLAGLMMIIFEIISPIITIVVYKLCLKLCAGLIEPLGNEKISSFLDDCSNVLIYPIVILIAVSMMYIITLSLIISTANII